MELSSIRANVHYLCYEQKLKTWQGLKELER